MFLILTSLCWQPFKILTRHTLAILLIYPLHLVSQWPHEHGQWFNDEIHSTYDEIQSWAAMQLVYVPKFIFKSPLPSNFVFLFGSLFHSNKNGLNVNRVRNVTFATNFQHFAIISVHRKIGVDVAEWKVAISLVDAKKTSLKLQMLHKQHQHQISLFSCRKLNLGNWAVIQFFVHL